MSRSCTVCGQPISPARLAAKPTASQCVACLEAAGDVPLIRRHDETYFKVNPALAEDLARFMHEVPSDAAFHVGIGEDGAYMGKPCRSVETSRSIVDEIVMPRLPKSHRRHYAGA